MTIRQRPFWLDRWRVIATVYVVAYHSVGYVVGAGRHLPPLAENALGKGYVGSSFFMLLSGFIITLVFGGKLTTREAVFGFWRSRLIRIYPPYLLLLVPGFLNLFILGQHQPFGLREVPGLLANVTLTMSYFPTTYQAYTNTSWTLCTLVLFYACFPRLYQYFHQLESRKLFIISLTMWMIYVLLPVLYVLLYPGQTTDPAQQETPIFSYLHYFPPIRLVEPVLGMLAAVYLRKSPSLSLSIYKGVFVLGLIVLVTSLFLPTESPIFPILHNGTYLPLLILLIASRYRISQISGRTERPFNVQLAAATLTVYLAHLFLLDWSIKLLLPLSSPAVTVFFSTLFAVFFSLLLHRWVSLPLSNWLGSRLPSFPRSRSHG